MAGKVTAAFAAATQETTLALANLNFDFALYKFEAPKEYSGVGQYLSKKRRDAAENGNEHIIARRLGALFGQALPATPTLIKAYGTRCSEITQLSAAAQKNIRSKTVFEDWIGADATSIWAAATSGNGAIPVHLLACMLARVWSAAEATAIWEEIVEHRKIELAAADALDPLGISLLAASRIEVTRDQLSRWDASARAWITVADGIKKKEQTQLMLLMSNLSLPVSGSEGVYGSVMSAWKSAMETMERALNQVSQSIQDGAGLVGLASWHLYPDIYALEAVDKLVKFHDSLVPSKVLVTLGAGYSSTEDDSSAHWSLPLAHLRYYGDPIPTTSTMAVTSSRLSMLECLHVVLGAVISTWSIAAADLDAACEVMIALSSYVTSKHQQLQGARNTNWLQHLSQTAQVFIASHGPDKQHYRNLIARGQRRYGAFLAPPIFHPERMFGLASAEVLFPMILNLDHKVAALRYIAKSLPGSGSQYMIRYCRPRTIKAKQASKKLASSKRKIKQQGRWEYATAVRADSLSSGVDSDESSDLTGHTRWVKVPPQFSTGGEEWKSLQSISIVDSDRTTFVWREHIPESRMFAGSFIHDTTYTWFFGEPDGAAIYRVTNASCGKEKRRNMIKFDLLLHAIEDSWIDHRMLIRSFENLNTIYVKSLAVLAAAANTYEQMPSATINPKVFTRTLAESDWALDLGRRPEINDALKDDDCMPSFFTLEFNREKVWACIAHFQKPEVAWQACDLTNVMALSCHNSIYVSAALVCDPYETPPQNEIKHIVGNIGLPGLSLIIPPLAPKTRKEDEEVWTHVNHNDFDGQFEDCFQHTSLHLKLTGYKMPIGSTTHGYVTSDAFFVESVVSILDRSTWVADLDILEALASTSLRRIHGQSCKHQDRALRGLRLTSIDSWEEYLDPPDQAGIFRSHRNWLARLAVVAHHAFHNREVFLFKDADSFCGKCVSEVLLDREMFQLSDAGRRDMWQLFVCQAGVCDLVPTGQSYATQSVWPTAKLRRNM